MKASTRPIQLQMNLQLEDGIFSQVEVADTDLGGELLPILSKGLYTYPLHAIREYVQNAVDANATEATIKITGNSVIIMDDGRGMDLTELVQARRFGVSSKDSRQNVGFRGIGIYSGFDLCNRLLITTKKAGQAFAYVLEFDFGAMKAQLNIDRSTGNRRTPIAKLLELYSQFSQESEDIARHYTVVQLEDIGNVHIGQISDREQLKKYILKNLPIDFEESFEYRAEINERLHDNVPGYNAIKVILESDGKPREVVVRPTIPHLGKPTTNPIVNSKNEVIAYYWACLREPPSSELAETPKGKADQGRGRIPDQFANYRGFVYKVKGFTIGDNTRLQSVFKRGNSGLYLWYTGEIYVTDPEVIPNTARDDFETSPAERTLENRVHEALHTLEDKASKYQEQGRALDRYTSGLKELGELELVLAEESPDLLTIYSRLDDIAQELKSQKRKLAPDKSKWAQDIVTRLDALKKRVRTRIEDPDSAPKKRRETPQQQEAADESDAEPQEAVDDTSQESADRQPQQSDQTSMATAFTSAQTTPTTASSSATTASTKPNSVVVPMKQLVDIIQDSGWALPEGSEFLVDIIDRSLADVLASGSAIHRAVLTDIEAKLAIEISE